MYGQADELTKDIAESLFELFRSTITVELTACLRDPKVPDGIWSQVKLLADAFMGMRTGASTMVFDPLTRLTDPSTLLYWPTVPVWMLNEPFTVWLLKVRSTFDSLFATTTLI